MPVLLFLFLHLQLCLHSSGSCWLLQHWIASTMATTMIMERTSAMVVSIAAAISAMSGANPSRVLGASAAYVDREDLIDHAAAIVHTTTANNNSCTTFWFVCAETICFKRLVFVFRSLHSLGSCLLDSLFSSRCNSNRTSTVTRAQVTNCLALPDVRTRSGLQSLSYTATKEWNSLPPLIRCVCSQPAFLMHLRNHLGHPVKRLRSVGTAWYK